MELHKLSPAQRQMFDGFLSNFRRCWGDFTPVSVEPCHDAANGPYLRFVYELQGRRHWLHVVGPGTWY